MRAARLPLLLFAAVCACSARADETRLPDRVRTILQRGVDEGAWQSVAVGLIDGDAVDQWMFGRVSRDADAPPTGTTVYELGAASAAFAGVLLADMATTGAVRLSDPVSRFLPEGMTCADERLCALTLEQLATQQTGLPALPPNLFPPASNDPFAQYDSDALLTLLANYRLPDRHQGFSPSPLAIGMLGWILGRVDSGDYAASVRRRLLEPLALAHTAVGELPAITGYDAFGTAAPWHFRALAAAGAMRTTLDDQVRFLQRMLRPGDSAQRRALLLSRQIHDGTGAGRVALGWRVANVRTDDADWPFLWQSGRTAGHASFLGFRTDRQRAVVLLGNSNADLAALGFALLTDTAPPPPPPRLRPADNAELVQYAGLYRIAHDDELILRVGDGRLMLQDNGRFALPMLRFGPDMFAFLDADAQVTFQRSLAGRVIGLRLHEGGVTVPATRLSERAPQIRRVAADAGAETFAGYCGDYQYDPDTLVRIHCRGSAIDFQLSASEPRRLTPFAVDRFASDDGEFELTFQRSAAGTVDRMDLVLAGVPFTLPRVEWTAPTQAALVSDFIGPPAPTAAH